MLINPKNWKIAETVCEDQEQICAWCRKPNGEEVFVLPDGSWCQIENYFCWYDRNGCGRRPPLVDGKFPWIPGHCGLDAAEDCLCDICKSIRQIRVVLTVVHLDHNPENCERRNLRALCQRCRLAYDRPKHLEERRKTRMRKSGQLQFEFMEST
jgi:hypothetical protein